MQYAYVPSDKKLRVVYCGVLGGNPRIVPPKLVFASVTITSNFCPAVMLEKLVIVVALLLFVLNVPFIPPKADTSGVAFEAGNVEITFTEALLAALAPDDPPPNHAGSEVVSRHPAPKITVPLPVKTCHGPGRWK